MTKAEAEQIATLLNSRNQLASHYTAHRVLDHAANYRFCVCETGSVIACVELVKVQWYQTEIRHLTVSKDHEGRGLAKKLLVEAERTAKGNGARLLQCTIREGNQKSRGLFEHLGYRQTASFSNEDTGNNVWVFQKVLVCGREV